jgi:hypothetical protein
MNTIRLANHHYTIPHSAEYVDPAASYIPDTTGVLQPIGGYGTVNEKPQPLETAEEHEAEEFNLEVQHEFSDQQHDSFEDDKTDSSTGDMAKTPSGKDTTEAIVVDNTPPDESPSKVPLNTSSGKDTAESSGKHVALAEGSTGLNEDPPHNVDVVGHDAADFKRICRYVEELKRETTKQLKGTVTVTVGDLTYHLSAFTFHEMNTVDRGSMIQRPSLSQVIIVLLFITV